MTRAAAAGVAMAVVLAIAGCGSAPASTGPRLLTAPDTIGNNMALEVVDETGELVDARAVSGDELVRLAPAINTGSQISALAGAEPNEIFIAWLSLTCLTTGRLTISPPNRISVITDPIPVCDAVGNVRAVGLSFRGPVNVGALELGLQPTQAQEKG